MNSVGLSSWKVVGMDRSTLSCSRNRTLEENSLQDETRSMVGDLQGSELGQYSRRILHVEQAGSTESSQRSAAMDPQIWGNLPVHILESILAWLPVSTLLKLRCVCKRFNNILYSPTLRATLRRISAPRRRAAAWYLFRGEGRECVAYNPDADSWCKLPLQALNLPISATGIRVVAAAGGLLCVRQGERMIVCNPLSKAWRELPPRQNTWKFPIVGMVMDTEVEEYKVVMAGSCSNSSAIGKNHLVTEVYSSRTKTWKLVVEAYPVHHLYQTTAVHCNGFLFSAGFDSILAYDLEHERWREMKGPAMQDAQLMLPQICECNGCLLMVEVVSEHWLTTRIFIWALQQPNNRWINLASMPQQILEEVISISGTRLFTYYGHGDLVCFTIARRRVLVFSMSRRRWRWLPRCPFVRGFARRCTTLAYEPRVEAMV